MTTHSKDIREQEEKTNFWYEGIRYTDPRAINRICEDYVKRLIKLGKYVSVEKHREQVAEARIDEAKKSKEIATIHFDSTGFTIATIFSDRIAQLTKEEKK